MGRKQRLRRERKAAKNNNNAAADGASTDVGSPPASASANHDEKRLCLHNGMSPEEDYHNAHYQNALEEWEELGSDVADGVTSKIECHRLETVWKEKFSDLVIDEEFATFVFAHCVEIGRAHV